MKKLTGFLFLVFLFSLLSISTANKKSTPSENKPPSPEIQKTIKQKSLLITKDPNSSGKYSVEAKTYRAKFTSEGFTFIKKNRVNRKIASHYSFKYQLDSVKIGDKVLWRLKDSVKIQPEIKKANKQVTYALTDKIKEVYEAKKGGIEQRWVISEKPSYLSELKSPEDTELIIDRRKDIHRA